MFPVPAIYTSRGFNKELYLPPTPQVSGTQRQNQALCYAMRGGGGGGLVKQHIYLWGTEEPQTRRPGWKLIPTCSRETQEHLIMISPL